jgi:beta-glucosidase
VQTECHYGAPVKIGAVLPLISTLGPAPSSDWRAVATPDTSGFLIRFAEDMAALHAAGVTDVRLPFDWSRWEPAERRTDRDVVEWHGQVLDAAEAAGVGVWACLSEGPVPGWFADLGGWGDEQAAGRHWPRFVDRVAETCGDRLTGWVPFDRPVQRLEAGWLMGARPPGRRDPERHGAASRVLLAAWRDAWRVLRGGPPVATALEVDQVEPEDESPDARQLARWRDEYRFDVWPRALRDGVVAVPGLAERPVDDLAGAVDVLGVAVTFDSTIAVDEPDQSDAAVERWVQQAGEWVRRLVDGAPERPLAVTLRLRRNDTDGREAGAKGLVQLVRETARDGMDVVSASVEPAIDGLLSPDREDTAVSRAVLALA